MSWLDANEVFVMGVVSRERVDDLLSAVEVSTETDDHIDEPAIQDSPWWCRRVAAARV